MLASKLISMLLLRYFVFELSIEVITYSLSQLFGLVGKNLLYLRIVDIKGLTWC
jgi:hypothetical protein